MSPVPDVYPDYKFHGANMGPTWILSAPDGPHVGPMHLAIWVDYVEYIGAGPLQRNEERISVTYW